MTTHSTAITEQPAAELWSEPTEDGVPIVIEDALKGAVTEQATRTPVEMARDELTAVALREPIKVNKTNVGPLLSYQQRTWPSYLRECWRYGRDYSRAVENRNRVIGALPDYYFHPFEERPKPPQPSSYGYMQQAVIGGLARWLKAKVA